MNDNEMHLFQHSWWIDRKCAVCHTKSIGINFGVPTCAPCKGKNVDQTYVTINVTIRFPLLAFFRRNARRKEVKEMS